MRKNIFRKKAQLKMKESHKNDNKISLAVCSLTYPLPNGVTASINTAVDALIESDKYRVKIVAPDYRLGRVRPEHETVPSSLIVHMAAKRFFGKEERVFRTTSPKKIDNLMKDFEPDIYWLHTVTYAANAFEKYMIKSGKGKVLFYHTLVEEYGRLYAGKVGERVMKKRSKDLCNKMDAVMTPSKMMKDRLLKNGVKTPISVIPTGIKAPGKAFSQEEVRKKYKLPENSKILLYLGRMSREKNLSALLKMLKELREKKYDACLLFVGPGDIGEVNDEAKSMGIDNIVFCTGPVERDEAQKIYGACDAFVFSSQSETQGLVVGEAMLAEIPVIALESPIQKEVYPRGKAAVVKKEEHLARAVIDTLDNKKSCKKMIKDAKDFVAEKFSQEAMMKKQMKVFEEVNRKYNKKKK